MPATHPQTSYRYRQINHIMKTYTRIVSYLNYFLFLTLLVSLFLPLNFVRWCWLLWAATWFLEGRWLHRENLRWDKSTRFIVCGFSIWFLWNILSVAWAGDRAAAWSAVARDTSMAGIVLLALWGVNEHYNMRQCLRVLLFGSIASVGLYMFTYYWIHNIPLAYEKLASEVHTIDWLHQDGFLLSIKHRMHYTNLLCMACVGLVLLHTAPLKENNSQVPRLLQWCGIIAATGVLLWGIYLSGSRTAVISLLLIGAFSIWWFFIRPRSKTVRILGTAGLVIMLVGGSVVGMRFHPRNAQVPVSEWTKVDAEAARPAFEPRFAIWEVATQTPSDYILYGVGAGNATDYMTSQYEKYGWQDYVSRQYSPHNQFLTICIELGIMALVLLVLLWGGLPFVFQGTTQYWMTSVVGIYFLDMMTDIPLGGLEGIVFFVAMYIIGSCSPAGLSPDRHEA